MKRERFVRDDSFFVVMVYGVVKEKSSLEKLHLFDVRFNVRTDVHASLKKFENLE